MRIEIRSRYTNQILYTAENVENVFQAVTEAVGKGADLQGADLRGAYLQGADLQGADLQGADLQGADLRGAYLQGADLQGADLQGADLRGAYLQGADLRGADLQGAYLQGAYLQGAYLQDIKGYKSFLFIGPIGSRNDHLSVFKKEDDSILIQTGCFSGTIDEFKKAVDNTHNGRRHGINYRNAILMIESYKWEE